MKNNRISSKTTNRLKEKYGDWILITGASAGIGRSMADLLSDAGFNLVICSRNKQLLTQMAKNTKRNLITKR